MLTGPENVLFRIFAHYLLWKTMIVFRKIFPSASLITILIFVLLFACNKESNDRLPLPPIDITINPNSTIYQEINIAGGWVYLDQNDGALPPSRGIIVYRLTEDQFLAFERTPPFKPDSCCNAAKTICTALIVDYPYVLDTCTNSRYLILDGSPVSGPSRISLGMYVTEYYPPTLYIHN
jgi:hypothetical protein